MKAIALLCNHEESPALGKLSVQRGIYSFLERFYRKFPLASRYSYDQFYEHANKRKGHATIIIHPQTRFPYMAKFNGHCALVTEYLDSSKTIQRQQISLEVKDGGSSGGKTHYVKTFSNVETINDLIWAHRPYYDEKKKEWKPVTRHDIGGYYPHVTFVVDLDKMKQQLKVVEEDQNRGAFDSYTARSNNCCTYVFNVLKGMGVDIKWPQNWVMGTWIHTPENLKKAAEESTSEKRGPIGKPTFFPKNSDAVYMDTIIWFRLLSERCKSYKTWHI